MRLAAFLAALMLLWAGPALADEAACTSAGIGAVELSADAPVTITSVAIEGLPDGAGRYCLVGVRVGERVNILVGLPMDGRWNGDLQAVGKGGYGGKLLAPVAPVARGYVGVSTDTGHPLAPADPGEAPDLDWRSTSGGFAMRAPGVANQAARADFASRSGHLMAVVAKQLATAFYGRAVAHAYWNGCSTEGTHALRAAADYPGDFDGLLVGDPAIQFAQVMAYQIWPQLVMRELTGGPILPAKLDLASRRALAACDGKDGLADSLIADPMRCRYGALGDKAVVRADCAAGNGACLSPAEAEAIDLIWDGPRDAKGKLLWRGIERGAPLSLLAGPKPFAYAILQPRYWVYLDPAWDWRTLTIARYPEFFAKSIAAVNPVMAPDPADLAAFFARGGKIMLYHGWNDSGILPHGSIDYYREVARRQHVSLRKLQAQFRLYMLPGVGHCGGGDAPQIVPDRMFDALTGWVEHGTPPEGLTAIQHRPADADRARPLCAWPSVARYSGRGDRDRAESLLCRR